MMRRRDVIALLGGAAGANSLANLPVAAWAQQRNQVSTIAWLGVSRGSRAPYPASGGAITISVPNSMKKLSGRAAAAV